MPAKQAIDGRRSTSSRLKARSYNDGFVDGIERCADRITLLAEQLDGDVGDRLKKFARWLQGGTTAHQGDPLVLLSERRSRRVRA